MKGKEEKDSYELWKGKRHKDRRPKMKGEKGL